MRTEQEILDRINEIETERKQLLEDYKQSNDCNEQCIIAERNMGALQEIQQLKWVLNYEENKPKRSEINQC